MTEHDEVFEPAERASEVKIPALTGLLGWGWALIGVGVLGALLTMANAPYLGIAIISGFAGSGVFLLIAAAMLSGVRSIVHEYVHGWRATPLPPLPGVTQAEAVADGEAAEAPDASDAEAAEAPDAPEGEAGLDTPADVSR